MNLLEARGLTKSFTSGTTEITVLDAIDLAVQPGEMTAIIGASGSGKTTLLQLLGTLAMPTAGELLFEGSPLLARRSGELAAFRNRSLGFVFQFHHLLPDFSALENVLMPGLIAGRPRRSLIRPATELLARVGLAPRLHHRILELSGGEQQRAALARALIMEPRLLLADEPTGNLDSRAGGGVFDLLQELCRERGLSTVMVTHNMALAARMDRCLTLLDGRLKTTDQPAAPL